MEAALVVVVVVELCCAVWSLFTYSLSCLVGLWESQPIRAEPIRSNPKPTNTHKYSRILSSSRRHSPPGNRLEPVAAIPYLDQRKSSEPNAFDFQFEIRNSNWITHPAPISLRAPFVGSGSKAAKGAIKALQPAKTIIITRKARIGRPLWKAERIQRA